MKKHMYHLLITLQHEAPLICIVLVCVCAGLCFNNAAMGLFVGLFIAACRG